MAGKFKIGAAISLDGEKAFKQSVTAINQDIKVLASEMSKVAAEFADNARGIDALTAKQDVLKRQLYNQEAAIENFRKALNNSAKEYGEADKRTKNWQISLNKAEAELSKTKSELNRTTKEMNDFVNETAEATKKSSMLGDIFKGGFLANLATGALSSVASAMKEIATSAFNTSDELMKMSDITGESVETLQAMQYAFDEVGFSADSFDNFQRKIIKSMSEAKVGASDMAIAFSTLGVQAIDPTTGALRDSTDVMFEAIDALGKVSNETERDALAMQIFGKSATELNPLIKAGSDALNDMQEKARSTGAVISEDAVKALDAFGDSVDHAKQQATAFAGEILATLIPSVASVSDVNDEIAKNNEISGLIERYVTLKDRLNDTSLSTDELRAVSEELAKVKLLLIDLSDGMISVYADEGETLDKQIEQYGKLNEAEKELYKQQQILNAQKHADDLKNEAELKDKLIVIDEKMLTAKQNLVEAQLKYNKMQNEGATGTEWIVQQKLIEGYKYVLDGPLGLTASYDKLSKEMQNAKAAAEQSAAAIKSLFDIGVPAREISEKVGIALGDVYNILNGVAADAKVAGAQTMQGYIDGVLGEKQNVISAFRDVTSAAVNKGVKEPLKINSPSKVMEELAGFTWDGFTDQTIHMSAEVSRAFAETARRATEATREASSVRATSLGNVSSASDHAPQASGRNPINLNINVISELDGQQIARATYKYNIEEAYLHGTSSIE